MTKIARNISMVPFVRQFSPQMYNVHHKQNNDHYGDEEPDHCYHPSNNSTVTSTIDIGVSC